MDFFNLVKIVDRQKKRVGRGIGSGKGKTSGRGTKGQKARGKVALGFIGGTLPFYKKIPFRRGIGNSPRSVKALLVPLEKLSAFEDKSEVTVLGLIEKKLVDEKEAKRKGIKIVNKGQIKKSLTITVPISYQAKAKIEKAGGKVTCA